MKAKCQRLDCLWLLVFLCALVAVQWTGIAHGGAFAAYGPRVYQPGTGTSLPVVSSSPAQGPSAPYTLKIYNGGWSDLQAGERVSSAVISFNNAPPSLNLPVTDVAQDIEALTSVPTVFDGSRHHDSDGDLITFRRWAVQFPAGSAASLLEPFRLNPQFVPDLPGFCVFELVVNDGTADSLWILGAPSGEDCFQGLRAGRPVGIVHRKHRVRAASSRKNREGQC